MSRTECEMRRPACHRMPSHLYRKLSGLHCQAAKRHNVFAVFMKYRLRLRVVEPTAVSANSMTLDRGERIWYHHLYEKNKPPLSCSPPLPSQNKTKKKLLPKPLVRQISIFTRVIIMFMCLPYPSDHRL